MANVVLLGALLEATRAVSFESVSKARRALAGQGAQAAGWQQAGAAQGAEVARAFAQVILLDGVADLWAGSRGRSA